MAEHFQVGASTPEQVWEWRYDALGNMTYNSDLVERLGRTSMGSGFDDYLYGGGGPARGGPGGRGRAAARLRRQRRGGAGRGGRARAGLGLRPGGTRLAYISDPYQGAKLHFLHPDVQGTIGLITDESGSVVRHTIHAPYGEVYKETASIDLRYGWTGAEKDRETELVHLGVRQHDPVLARFTRPGPITPDVFNPRGLNPYAYGLNNPVGYTDPSGYAPREGEQKGGFEDWMNGVPWYTFSPVGVWSFADQSGSSTVDLTFDGEYLSLYRPDGELLGRWNAVSGRPGYQDPRFQYLKNTGPLPEGLYYARHDRLQGRPVPSSWSGLLVLVAGWIGQGTWQGGSRAWGDFRLWLDPALGTETGGRNNFSIHGGATAGSAGCIDLTGSMDDFVGAFRRQGRDLLLEVRYHYSESRTR